MIAMASRILSSRKSGKICMSLRMSGNVMKEMIKKCLWPITEISLIEKINNISPRFSSKKKVHLWQVPGKKKSGLWVLQGPANGAMWPGWEGGEPLRKWSLSSDVGKDAIMDFLGGKEERAVQAVESTCHRRKRWTQGFERRVLWRAAREGEAGQGSDRSQAVLRISFVLKSDLRVGSLWLQGRWMGGGQRGSRATCQVAVALDYDAGHSGLLVPGWDGRREVNCFESSLAQVTWWWSGYGVKCQEWNSDS